MDNKENQNSNDPFVDVKTAVDYIKEDYIYAINELGFNNYQAFTFAYDESYQHFNSESILIKFLAYTALFFNAYELEINFIYDSPFTNDVINELKAIYKEFYSKEENLKQIPDMQNAESQKIIQVVKDNYVNIGNGN